MTWSGGRRRPRRIAIVATGLITLSCKRAPTPTDRAPQEGPGVGAALAPHSEADAGVVAARCKIDETASATLADVGDRRSLLVGEATAAGDGFAVGIVRAAAAGPEALVAQVKANKSVSEWVVAKRGELVPDAPPPKPLATPGGLYAALLARRDHGARAIVLRKSGTDAPVGEYAQRIEGSLALDASVSADGSRAALAWDDAALAPTSGGITVGVVLLAGKALPARVVSGDTADPDSPHLVPRSPGGWWVAWLAHRPEAGPDAGHAAASLEGPAEDRAYSWVEIVAIAEDGAPSGAPRRITSAVGHAASFDLAPRAGGELDVVVRDETQAREGEGGRVLHVVVRSDGGSDEPGLLVSSGVGRGSVDLVTGDRSEAWLTYQDARDHTLVVPLGSTCLPLGLPSAEDALEEGRLLWLASPGPPARFFAAFPGADGALFREVACTP